MLLAFKTIPNQFIVPALKVSTAKIEVSDDFCKECIGNVSLWKVICGEKQLKTAIF